MTSLRELFGRRLRQLRLRQGFTQEELAEATELSVEFISNMERAINAPSFETLSILADVFQVPVKDLFDFSDKI